jgi:DNA-directed RNA polymerase subunit RPC12/RpoP
MSDDELVEILNEGANENAMVARILRHVEDRPVCPRPEDFYAALKHDPAVVVRLHGELPGEREIPIDCRFRRSVVEFTHELRDVGFTGRDQFLQDIRDATEVEVLHHRDSEYGDGWVCYDCGEECFDPDSEHIQSQNMVRVTCPECGTIDEIPQGSQPPREGCDDGLVTDGGQSTSGTYRCPECGRYPPEEGHKTDCPRWYDVE